ncbi:MAG: malto-oligosyltrehalose trehalohydrolase [Syntrophobacterales bacterium]|nr:malto-oligosyltrehalose trehalohydrolase [Syntrophobacterales bacterium]
MPTTARVGAAYLGEGRCRFLVWAPYARQVEVHLVAPRERLLPLAPQEHGYFAGVAEGVEPGARYFFRLNGGREYPDPASRFQPEGVHGPSEVVDPAFPWEDGDWGGLPLEDYVLYELHVGTFTPEGTFEAVIPHLDSLKALGVTALELMPVAQFPGERNWGYDGVYPFAVQASYGGPAGLKSLVNACHARGLAVVLDVVYNHLGPEGNYFWAYGPYFTERYRTPWGPAVNVDGPQSDHVRRLFIDNALYWGEEFHVDALRLDALHAIVDLSPRPFLLELAQAVGRARRAWRRHFYLMAESDLNDARLLKLPELGGLGLDAHWSEDFHHALHTLLTGERVGYYQDYGRLAHLAKAWREGFVYTGQYSPYRQRRHGSSVAELAPSRLVVFSQNHDQVGNRPRGERLSTLVPPEALKLAAGVVLLSPFTPLLFMGEEYGETAPFPYFVSHTDPELLEAVRRGRREEHATLAGEAEIPDPGAPATFLAAKLNHSLKEAEPHRRLWDFYRELLVVRRELRERLDLGRGGREVQGYERERLLVVQLEGERAAAVLACHFGRGLLELFLPWPEGVWRLRLDSAAPAWGGPGRTAPGELISDGRVRLTLAPWSLAVYVRGDDR